MKLGKGWGNTSNFHAPLVIEPDNWDALAAFVELAGQWNVTASGYILGLKGEVVLSYLALLSLDNAEKQRLFRDINTIARAYLDEIKTND